MQDPGEYTRTDPTWEQQQQQQQQQPQGLVCDECAKRCTWRKMALTFLVQAALKIVHGVKGIFN